ncbi:uncharacterized protein BDZ99DRAFT_566400 [Mytilinidion resinicola]|uniref:Uncharacterized protein n=1 Tax=Mytilinidion resinicola TaxID=574789 RepID=A0A6A6Z6Z6_9PEZI|nr:uncharacterized protein BDZ99DRAFT_566400 [Mytilinidion resinicola]KAF2816588.1 hypothetical protein BDZ99DRAFT_566400 [Mytilinidion resinicola]
MMGSTTSTSYPLQAFSLWIHTFPPRIGSEKTFDLAMRYFVESGEAFRCRREVAESLAPATRENALTSLRCAMSVPKVDDSILLAISLHVFAEVFIALGTFHYVAHIRGLSHILHSRIASLSCIEKDLDFMLINSTYLEEITDALRRGRDCIYDTKASTAATSRQCVRLTAPDVASTALIQQFVKIPRLARLVRACAACPTNTVLLSETTQLAEELYFSPVGDLVTRSIGEVGQIQTLTPRVAQVLEQSLQYSSIEEFALAIRFETYRVLLSGILQTLHWLDPFSSQFDIEAIESQDTEAATIIAMSVDYAMTVDRSLPLPALRILTPLQYSFGAWYRLAKRQCGNTQGMYGVLMQEWSLCTSNAILKDWKAPEDSLSDICTRSESFAGARMVYPLAHPWETLGPGG